MVGVIATNVEVLPRAMQLNGNKIFFIVQVNILFT